MALVCLHYCSGSMMNRKLYAYMYKSRYPGRDTGVHDYTVWINARSVDISVLDGTSEIGTGYVWMTPSLEEHFKRESNLVLAIVHVLVRLWLYRSTQSFWEVTVMHILPAKAIKPVSLSTGKCLQKDSNCFLAHPPPQKSARGKVLVYSSVLPSPFANLLIFFPLVTVRCRVTTILGDCLCVAYWQAI